MPEGWGAPERGQVIQPSCEEAGYQPAGLSGLAGVRIRLSGWDQSSKGQGDMRSRFQSLVATFVVLGIFFAHPAAANSGGRRITVVLRYDDYSGRSATELEVKMIDAFRRYGIRSTFGVIPFVCAQAPLDPSPQELVPLTPAKAAILSAAIRAGVVEAGLHGYSHQTTRSAARCCPSEFDGVDRQAQIERIKKGKEYLETVLGASVTTFMPPWNSYDLDTLRALEETGFKTLSASRSGEALASSSIIFLPWTAGVADLRTAIESARRGPDSQPMIVVLLHDSDFREVDRQKGIISFEDFEKLLAWVASQQDVAVLTLGEAAKDGLEVDTRRYLSNKAFFYFDNELVPEFLSRLDLSGAGNLYMSPDVAEGMRTKAMMAACLFYLLILAVAVVISAAAAHPLFRWSRPLARISLYGAIALFLLLASFPLRDMRLSYRRAMAVAVSLGLCVGFSLAYPKESVPVLGSELMHKP